jgi:hypothetical protein
LKNCLNHKKPDHLASFFRLEWLMSFVLRSLVECVKWPIYCVLLLVTESNEVENSTLKGVNYLHNNRVCENEKKIKSEIKKNRLKIMEQKY